METLIFQIVVWVGIVVVFLLLRDGGQGAKRVVAEAVKEAATPPAQPMRMLLFDKPDQLVEVIGTYMDWPIFRYAVFGGVRCQFSHILPRQGEIELVGGERYLAPGLVYVEAVEA